MDKKIWVLQIAGWIMLVCSVTALAVLETDSLLLILSYNKIIGYILSGSLCCIGLIFLGASWYFLKKSREKKENIDIFKMLTKYSGQITPSEFSLETGLDFKESRKRLDDLHKNGVCKRHITKTGIMIYHFPDFEIHETAIIH